MTSIAKSEFKSRALEYFRQIKVTGEPVIITDHGIPKLEIRRYQSPTANPLERLRGSVLHYENPLAPIAPNDWQAAN